MLCILMIKDHLKIMDIILNIKDRQNYPYLWDFPGKNTRVGCHFLLQGIFLTQGSNPHLLH